VAAAMLVIVSLVGFLIFRNSNKSRNRASAAPSLQEQVMASLTVLEGPHGRKGEKIRLSKTKYVIGRQGADVVFYADAPRSTISRVHCTITRDADMSFWITDNVSSNGTRVNSKLVPPNERHPLLNGDQVQLGDAERNGVLLQFSLDHPTQFVQART
jgi:pSer/pThr/pTyr-binding forkhead associated (FHA) protein